MKRQMARIALIFVLLAAAAPAAMACGYTFDVSLVAKFVDVGRSIDNTFGFEDWYVWIYRVDVVKGETNHALSNWVLQLPDCYIASKDLFKEIEASAGGGIFGDKVRIYNTEGVVDDSNLDDMSGLKWEWQETCWFKDELDQRKEYDYFWFSVPTDMDIDGDWGVKAGQEEVYGDVEVPDCPGCENSGTPEPVSSALFIIGLGGLGLWKKKRSVQ
ncbi:MAG: PEP-CTERM sorting domain-containing protein [Candidatus Omnitrophica bacterium]|nr:PEP-CTERM sorting domain-containing protein [Candidatus Omnitrophota bacterium]MDD5574537.1 PEP-CTERM sorting domain-containing protein [Candidatus Omnitrophota bacterium]